ncbi:tripartite motif-containing protein 2 [Patella vulgata]|uniref:tripartite motif-containing protein 2 n=1 Tax=Patella vulgata TaxID=6465 RepID=UPI00217F753A|nr:tripartite motif-containing protein 2 [Patella vulgata]
MAQKVSSNICSICFDDFENPRIIDCHHSFCEDCLDGYINSFTINGRFFLCPICGKEIKARKGAKKFPRNFYLDDKSKTDFNSTPCGMCKTSNTSKFKCKDCDRYLCTSCKSMHDTLPPCSGHHVVTLDTTILGDTKGKTTKKNCPKHSDSCMEFYCRDCTETICMKCLMTNHRHHMTSDIADVCSEAVQELKEIEEIFQEKLTQSEENSASLRDTISEIQSSYELSCEHIYQQVQKVRKSVTDAGDCLKNSLKMTFGEEEEKIKKFLKGKEDVAQQLRTNVQSVAEMIQNEQMMEAVKSLPSFRAQLEEINSVDLEIPQLSCFASFQENKINTGVIMSLLGTIKEINRVDAFNHTFSLNQLKRDGREETECREIKREDLIWYLTIKKGTTGMMFIGIGLKNTNIKSLSGKFTLKLAVSKSDKKSAKFMGNINLKDGSMILTTETNLTWAELCDPNRGFIDVRRKRFLVKASVSVTDMTKTI